jgi:hypothetical protein
LAAWAAGGSVVALNPAAADPPAVLAERLLALAEELGQGEAVAAKLREHAGDVSWIRKQIGRAEQKLAERVSA